MSSTSRGSSSSSSTGSAGDNTQHITVAVNRTCTVVGVGTTDCHIRVIDPRMGDKVAKLKV